MSAENISLNHPFYIVDLSNVINNETQVNNKAPVFIKFAPLLDPLRYMIGKYEISDNKTTKLPTLNCNESTHLTKLISKYNASYVDNFFSFLTSKILQQHQFVHGLDYYGSFLGIQEKYKMNIMDDLEYLNTSEFFLENIGKYFYISDNKYISALKFRNSRGNKPKLTISGSGSQTKHNTSNVSFIDLGDSDKPTGLNDLDQLDGLEEIYEKPDISSHNSTESSYNSSNNSKLNYSSEEEGDEEEEEGDEEEEEGDEEDWSTDSEDEKEEEKEEEEEEEEDWSTDSEEEAVYSYIDNYPVQMICIEKCDGTLDELFMKNKVTEKTGASILFQIVMILLTYQKIFHFTHNDLHTNNIMYINTDVEYLFYKYKNQVYKVPTYGKIFKLIDFGRGIYRFQSNQYCSDSFFTGGDAATQYNFEPFMNDNKPRLDPNYSFDLCRLGTSIYDFVIDDYNIHSSNMNKLDGLQDTILRWCLDDNNKNVLYKRNGSERYKGFSLYKMISRSVHNHTPEEQLKFDYFKQFESTNKDIIGNSNLMDIDSIPSYAL
jgi:hypothetical protein